jgi:DnaJ-class molecular chaperone
MVKLVTVIETQACRSCGGSGHAPNGHMCAGCGGTGKVDVEVHR